MYSLALNLLIIIFLTFERKLYPMSLGARKHETSKNPACAGFFDVSIFYYLASRPTNNSATMLSILIIGLIAGPAVSLYESSSSAADSSLRTHGSQRSKTRCSPLQENYSFPDTFRTILTRILI